MKDEIVLYQPNETIKLEVHLKDETVWLTQQQIADLFGVKQPAISKHIANIYKSGELEEEGTYSILEYMGHDGKQLYTAKAYNLDMILSVGYRVNSTNATRFRQWANRILKDYLLRGYAFNQRLANIEHQMDEQRAILATHEEKIDFFVRTSLPPVEGIFYDGEIYEAYSFVSDLIRSAKTRIVLIDNYIDDRVLTMLDKRNDGVKATIYTKNFTRQLSLDIAQHNKQFAPIDVEPFNLSHDRFMIIDDIVYIKRGYEDFDGKLRSLGAKIECVCTEREARKFMLKVG